MSTEAGSDPRRQRLIGLIALGLVLLLVEITFQVGLFVFEKTGRGHYQPVQQTLTEQQREVVRDLIAGNSKYIQHDPTLGWSLKPAGQSGLYRANAAGLRGDRDLNPAPPAGRIRVAAYGESFTHGDEVKNSETWETQLEVLRPDLEVPNFGVPGFGPDQTWLRYEQMGGQYPASVVLFGYMSENIARAVNTFRPFMEPLGPFPLSKPRYLPEGEGLTLLDNPLPDLAAYQAMLDDERGTLARLAEHDAHVALGYTAGPLDFLATARFFKLFAAEMRGRDPRRAIYLRGVYNPDGPGFPVVTRIFEGLHGDAEARGAVPVFLLFPHKGDLALAAAGAPRRDGPLLDWLNQRGWTVIDGLDAFRPAAGEAWPDLDGLFVETHYSAAGNARVARLVAERLVALGLIPAEPAPPPEEAPEGAQPATP